ncbi:MAG: NAD(P)/FAD-dependent oxidoreductase [Leptothrix sp. (in: b-proteobacteria)]
MSTPAPTAPIDTDAIIIGAGPVGLYQVFQLGLQEIRAHVIDALPHPGGQCAELYPDKPIYDLPGLPVCTGAELIERLLMQIRPMQAVFHLDQLVTELTRLADGRWQVGTTRGLTLRAPCVVIAAGVGAFVPRALAVDGLDAHLGSQLFYRVTAPDQFAGLDLVITGGEEGAVEHALRLAEAGPTQPRSITLIHRRDNFRAPEPDLQRLRECIAAGGIRLVLGQISALRHDATGRLQALGVTGRDGAPLDVPLDALLVQLGISPKLGPLTDWGLALERKQLQVDPASCATSAPGVYAVGDINSYPGKKKLILCGFFEATLAAFAAAAQLHPDEPQPLLYTTTSPKLQRILGVAPTPSD